MKLHALSRRRHVGYRPRGRHVNFGGGPVKIGGIAYTDTLSAQPENVREPAVVRVDLSSIKAVRFKAVLGGDFPVGDEAQRRKTVAIRSEGKEARFLAVIEPFEDKRVVKSAQATGPGRARVELSDGRVHEIDITGLDAASPEELTVAVSESRDGQTLRVERTRP